MRVKRSMAFLLLVGAGATNAFGDHFVQVFQYSDYPPTSGNFITQDPGTTHGDDVVFTLEEATRYVMVLPLGGTGPYNLDVDIGRVYPQVGSITTPREVKLSIGGKFVALGGNGDTIDDPTKEHWGHY